MEAKAYMYVLECADGTLYTGYSTDVKKRLAVHNAGKGAKYTRARLPVKLLYHEEYPDKSSAMSAEALFKQKTRKKNWLILKHKKMPNTSLAFLFFIKLLYKIDTYLSFSAKYCHPLQ